MADCRLANDATIATNRKGEFIVVTKRGQSLLSSSASYILNLVLDELSWQEIVSLASKRLSELEAVSILSELSRSQIINIDQQQHRTAKSFQIICLGISASTLDLSNLGPYPIFEDNGQLPSLNANTTYLVFADDIRNRKLLELNFKARSVGATWLLVTPLGPEPLVGPLFFSEVGPCWQCLDFAYRRNKPVDEFIDQHLLVVVKGKKSIDATSNVCLSLTQLAIEQLNTLTKPTSHPLFGQLISVDVKTLQTQKHKVRQRPQCPGCGDKSLMTNNAKKPISLTYRPFLKQADGGLRNISAERTIAQYQHVVSPITGAVSHLAPMPGKSPHQQHVFVSGFFLPAQNDDIQNNVFDQYCAGKGKTPQQARAGALAEAIERYSGIHQGDEAQIFGSYNDLKDRHKIVSPESLQPFSQKQFKQREKLNATTPNKKRWIPKRFETDQTIAWTPAWSLLNDELNYLPLSYCYMGTPERAGSEFFIATSNGSAAGNNIEEATIQGLFELVERDATAIWWYNQIRRPRIDLYSFESQYMESIEREYHALGYNLWVLDITHDLNIPVCVSVVYNPKTEHYCLGFGSHLDLKIAVERSLTEVNQLFLLYKNRVAAAPWDSELLTDRSFLFPSADSDTVLANKYGTPSYSTIDEAIKQVQNLLSKQDLELLLVNKTRPEIGLSVVQVVVPGLRHFWPQFAPGRLYDVPISLGWRNTPHLEDTLNPVPLFL